VRGSSTGGFSWTDTRIGRREVFTDKGYEKFSTEHDEVGPGARTYQQTIPSSIGIPMWTPRALLVHNAHMQVIHCGPGFLSALVDLRRRFVFPAGGSPEVSAAGYCMTACEERTN